MIFFASSFSLIETNNNSNQKLGCLSPWIPKCIRESEKIKENVISVGKNHHSAICTFVEKTLSAGSVLLCVTSGNSYTDGTDLCNMQQTCYIESHIYSHWKREN